MTRNSPLWWIGILGAVLSMLAQNQFDLLHRAFPTIGVVWDARLQLALAAIGVVSAFFRMSPLALSADSALAGTADPTKTLSIMPSKKD